MTASEARAKAETFHSKAYNTDYTMAKKRINEESEKGEYNLYLYCKIHPLTVKKLKEEEYTVFEESSEMGGYTTKISW